jgi:Ca2+:H+ antiporter
MAPVTASARHGKGLLPYLADNKLNWLLVFLPIAVGLRTADANDVLIFVTSGLAVLPLAGVIGGATEQVARYVGPALGGLLNATFGNAAELLIALLALQRGLTEVVKASLTGSILGNLLLVLGLAMLVGGWNRERQTFNRTHIGAASGMLVLTVVALLMPDIYAESVSSARPLTAPNIMAISVLVAVVMLLAYGASLFFSLKTHRGLLAIEHHEEPPVLSRRDALVLLGVATVLTAVAAEILVGSIENTAEAVGWTDLFVGAIVVAIVGNAAEHFSAVLFARRDQMELAVGIAISSATQVALLVAPVAVLASLVFGHPMPLVFDHVELGAIMFAVLGVSFLCMDGESNWFEGALLLGFYAIIAIIFYFVHSAVPGLSPAG